MLSARRPAVQMAEVRRRLSAAHGRTFTLAGRRLASFPTPERLLTVTEFDGISETKVRRLHGVAAAASEGRLDAGRLRAMGVDAGGAELRRLDGIGPFYASLVMVRASGLADVMPTNEPRLKALVADLYHLPAPPDAAEMLGVAEPWRPLRTWVAVLVRAVGGG